MNKNILFGLVFLCMVGSVFAVDDFLSLQAYTKGGLLNVNAVPLDNGTRVYDLSVSASCVDSKGIVNSIGDVYIKSPYVAFMSNSNTSCKEGDIATVCSDNYCESLNITHKHNHIGHKKIVKTVKKDIVKPVVVNPFDVLNDELESCKLNTSIWFNDSLKNCAGLYGKKLHDCNMFNYFIYQQYNFKIFNCQVEYDMNLCKLNNGTWSYHKCVVKE